VDGVYDKDPMKSTDAVKFASISYKDALSRGLNIMDHSAIAMAMDYSLPLFICKISEINLI
jgi:uridylate kinase